MHCSKLPFAAGLLLTILSSSCSDEAQTEKVLQPVRVETLALATAQAQGGSIQYTGTVRPSKAVRLSFMVSGNVVSIPVEQGQYVKKGQLLATLDETTYRRQYEAQLAQLRLAEENYKRVAEVYSKGSIAEINMLQARSQFEQAQAAARATYQNIAHTKLYAPQSGYIGSKYVEVGSLASPGVPVVEIVDISPVVVEVPVPEAEVNSYAQGDTATVQVQASGGEKRTGTVDEVAVLAAAGTPNYTVKISLPNPEEQLKPGMVGTVVFENKKGEAADATGSRQIIVPVQAVQAELNGQNFVYVASPDGQKAIRKNVRTGNLYNSGIEVTEGLQGSETLIVSGYHKLADNSPIQIIR
ncbi:MULTISPECIES: efflux RND transporter periplasmic adaptor subunit [Hymenobacteraceae]|uniref:RND family efflux transporter, MFP subunit n=3 Tax=Pontibacter TaxID=323449 RepID=A0A239JC12_9BACT|nr:efflux RND transporter periplasmic adaptor subunit [Rufibacter sp. XAAS-G3-1]PRY08352.1 RND family efflux transporter MFP subunit [Pontibacter ummariensis]PVY38351.1 RND family efflux transporter MFP subunit [Pontibacter virosus]SNT03367.1 RND family efflux transporter, MFP subunit [Pontibacter ummariensis]